MLPESVDPYVLQRAVQLRYKRSLFDTAKYLLSYKDITEYTHLRITETLQDETDRKLICVPRGTFKSSICSVAWPIWLLINNPNLRIFIDSELYANSVAYLREIKQHMQSEPFLKVFGDWQTATWNEAEIIIKPRTKILKEPSIMVGGIGTTKVGMHYDVIIGDDYCSPSNMATKEQRDKVTQHYQMNQAILDPGGIYAIIGTRYSEDDIIGHIIKNELGFKSVEDMKSHLAEAL